MPRHELVDGGRQIPGDALKAETVIGPPKMSGQAAENVDVDRLALGEFALQPFGLDGEAGGAAAELRLGFGEEIGAAEVGDVGFEDIPIAACPRGLPIARNEQAATVAHGGPCMGRAWGRNGTKGHRSTVVRGPEPREPGSSDAKGTVIGWRLYSSDEGATQDLEEKGRS